MYTTLLQQISNKAKRLNLKANCKMMLTHGNHGGGGNGYTLDHIINDCVSEKSRVDVTKGRNTKSRVYYEECWSTLNQWIETRLKKRLGASISPLGNFTWEIIIENNEKLVRPIFLLHESFIKDHHLKQKYFHKPKNLAKCEEVNYSNLAIKFSKSLTKDMIYSGIRDILKKLGDYVDRFYEIEIQFLFGTLYSKDRRIRFEFDNSRLLQILPESMTSMFANQSLGYDTHDYGPDKEGQGEEQENPLMISTTRSRMPMSNTNEFHSSSSSSLSSTLPNLNLSHSARPATTTSHPSSRLNSITSAPSSSFSLSSSLPHQQQQNQNQNQTYNASSNSSNSNSNSGIPNLNLSYKNIDRSVPPPPLSPGLRELLISMNNPNLSHQMRVQNRVQCCDNVAQQAFTRCLSSVENNAIDDDYIEFQRKLLHKEYNDKEKNKREKFKKELVDIQNTLRLQMNESNQRKIQEISERKHGKIHFGLPGQQPKVEPSLDEIREQKEAMLRGLQRQISSSYQENALSKQQLKQEEALRLRKLQEEVEVDRLVNKTKELEKQRDLLEAWEKDAHVKNLQRLVTRNKGSEAVKSYIKNTGLISAPSPSGSGRGGEGGEEAEGEGFGLSRSRGTFRLNDSGIGFDTRRK
jgi:hypothetical protein